MTFRALIGELAMDLPNESTLFCYDIILVIQFHKVHDIREYNNNGLQMLQRIESNPYSALTPSIQGQIRSSVGTKVNSFFLTNISLIVASFWRTIG